MIECVNWCNDNNGFITAVLSVIGLFLSFIAIVVSVRTARLPYRKKIKLSFSTDVELSYDPETGKSDSRVVGMSVNAANVGFRNICITYLGIGIKNSWWSCDMQKLGKVKGKITGTGMVEPTQLKTESFGRLDLAAILPQFEKKAKAYVLLQDTEGKEYKKKITKVKELRKTMSIP